MKKLACLSLVTIIFAIASDSYAGGFTPVPMAMRSTSIMPMQQQQPMASFTQIDSIGHFNITIKPITSSSQNSFVITSPLANNAQVYAVINNGALFLRQSPEYPNPINVTVYMNKLTALNVFGDTNVFGDRVRGSSLRINANTNGDITLNGSIMLREADIAGATQLNLSWVYGNAADLYEFDNAYMNISGNIDTVRAKLRNHSFLDARYLRTRHTWIKTNDYAQAKVIASASVQSYPQNYSNIYYYKTPGLINRVNSNSGNTLQLGWSH